MDTRWWWGGVLAGGLWCGCGAKHPPHPPVQGTLESADYTLVCPSVLGDLTTTLTYTVKDDFDPVAPGGKVTYWIHAPIAQVKSPITPTFESSSTTFAVPDGLQVESVAMDPTMTDEFTSAQAHLGDGGITFELKGSFKLDGKDHPVPALVVVGTVTAPAGSRIVWNTPTDVSGKANAGVFGEQESQCHVQTPGPIGTTQVESPEN